MSSTWFVRNLNATLFAIPMLLLRRSSDRGHVNHGWLDTYHTFSFARYYDPAWMGFGPLRVINEDRIDGKQGFGEHDHSDMEILTYVIEGALQHRDSLGHGSIIQPNEIQYMSAGSGITHSEFNPGDESVHLLQIWIEPNVYGLPPTYEDRKLKPPRSHELELLASGDGREGSVKIRQDADMYRGVLAKDTTVSFRAHPQRIQWIQVISGELQVQDTLLSTGDACGVTKEETLRLTAQSDVHILLFDLSASNT